MKQNIHVKLPKWNVFSRANKSFTKAVIKTISGHCLERKSKAQEKGKRHGHHYRANPRHLIAPLRRNRRAKFFQLPPSAAFVIPAPLLGLRGEFDHVVDAKNCDGGFRSELQALDFGDGRL